METTFNPEGKYTMNKTLITLALVTTAFTTTNVIAQSSPLDMAAYTQSGQNILEFTALENNLQINNIIVNKGNCETKLVYSQMAMLKRKPRPRFPVTLQYGQATKAWTFMKGCNLREVTAETNQGDWTWTW